MVRIAPLLLLFISLLCNRVVAAEQAARFDLATCKDNAAIDTFLRKASPLYNAMARIVEFQGGYEVADKTDIPAGEWNPAERKICVNSLLAGPHRVSIVAFEMTNAYQQRLHAEIDMAVVAREITTKTEFALRHELVEYDGLRLHREILIEIEKHLGKVPPEFFFMAGSPKPDSVAKYQLPLVMDFLKDMKAKGMKTSTTLEFLA